MTVTRRRGLRVGTSGWQYADWRPSVYPPGLGQARWLTHYAERFDTEIVITLDRRHFRRQQLAAGRVDPFADDDDWLADLAMEQ